MYRVELNVYEMENEKGKEMKVDFVKKIKCAYVLCAITSQANSNFMTIRERHFRQKTTMPDGMRRMMVAKKERMLVAILR